MGRFDEFLHRNMRHLMTLRMESDDLSQMMCRTLSRALCLHIFREYASGDPTTQTTARTTTGAVGLTRQASDLIQDYIQTYLDDPITLETLAQLAGLSTHNLLTAFRRAVGTTAAQHNHRATIAPRPLAADKHGERHHDNFARNRLCKSQPPYVNLQTAHRLYSQPVPKLTNAWLRFRQANRLCFA